jgi:serine/threonine protein kinase/Tfp pilus assembly protein PilF
MEIKDWQRIESLFHTALELDAEERTAYIARTCGTDEPLRKEVESLIAAFECQGGRLEQPAFNLGMKILSDGPKRASLAGKLIGPYKILQLLGQGGMGEVYLAEDTGLGRKVALKFLSNKFTDDGWAKRQLTKEAQAVAMLDHPNICTVHGIETYDGYSYMVMQYVEGETMASLTNGKTLEVKQALNLAGQIASALAEAHSHGIIHRDITPRNIMVTTGGQVKMLDFGLAKVVQQRQGLQSAVESRSNISKLGFVVGTVAYMSPEQLRAERLDFRSDIFSFGTVLYEMLSGRNPYAREQDSEADIISAILKSDPPPLKDLVPHLPSSLDHIVQKCLQKNREQRYQSASEMLLDLDNFEKGIAVAPPIRNYVSSHMFAVLALILLLVIGGALVYSRQTRVPTLAVLPIAGESADHSMDYLKDGITEAVINKLSHLSRLKVKAFTLVSGYKGRQVDPQQIGRELDVDTVLVGTVIQRGEQMVLQTNLINTSDGSQIWSEKYDINPAEMLTLQEELSDKITSKLNLLVSSDEKRQLNKRGTNNAEAFRQYWIGRYYWNKRDKENIKKAIDYFNRAIDLDPAYAQAYAGLADSYILLPTVAYGSVETAYAVPRARSAASKALDLDNTLCEARTALGVVKLKYDWNWTEAEKEFKQAIDLNPEYASAHFWYSNLLAITGHLDEAIAESEKAKEFDPFSPLVDINLGRAYYYAGQYDRAGEYFSNMLKKEPDNLRSLYMLGLVYQQKHMTNEAIEAFEKVYARDKALAAAPLGYAYARAGRKNDALAMVNEIDKLSQQSETENSSNPIHISPQEKGIIYIGLDDREQAFTYLQQACDEKFASLTYLKVEPLFNSLHSDPRFADLVRCVKL